MSLAIPSSTLSQESYDTLVAAYTQALQQTNIVYYHFPDAAFKATPVGCTVDPQLSSALWVGAQLIASNVAITPAVRDYAARRRMRPVPRLFEYPFQYGINFLGTVHHDLATARAEVQRTQTAAQEAMNWLVELIAFAEADAIHMGTQLPPGHTSTLDYYRCLTYPSQAAADTACRAMVPYRPSGNPPKPPHFPLTGGEATYAPEQPRLLPQTSFGVSNPIPTPEQINGLFVALMGQEGVRARDNVQAGSSSEILVEELN